MALHRIHLSIKYIDTFLELQSFISFKNIIPCFINHTITKKKSWQNGRTHCTPPQVQGSSSFC